MPKETPSVELFTVGQAAERIARASRQKPEFVARQIRNFIQRHALFPAAYRGDGATAAAMLALPEICQARILCALAERGFSIPLDDTRSALSAAHQAMQANVVPEETLAQTRKRKADNPRRPIEVAMSGIRAGEFWALGLTFYRDQKTARPWIEAKVFREGAYRTESPDLPGRYQPEGLHLVYLTPLLQPLLAN